MEEPSGSKKIKTSRGSSAKAPTMREIDDEYQKKRERNNIAVRKSRKKAKEKIEETRQRVVDLSKENDDLRSKVSLLQKELNVLRSLFANGGITLPNATELNVQLSNGISNGSGDSVVLTTVALPSEVMQAGSCSNGLSEHINRSSDA